MAGSLCAIRRSDCAEVWPQKSGAREIRSPVRFLLTCPQQAAVQIPDDDRNADRRQQIGAHVIARLFHRPHPCIGQLLALYAAAALDAAPLLSTVWCAPDEMRYTCLTCGLRNVVRRYAPPWLLCHRFSS